MSSAVTNSVEPNGMVLTLEDTSPELNWEMEAIMSDRNTANDTTSVSQECMTASMASTVAKLNRMVQELNATVKELKDKVNQQ